ncbi:MAG: hypothetical protein ACRDNL_11320 [Spirillospora sp.]
MTQLRVLAPVVVDYYTVPGASLRDPDGYARFWADQQPAVDALLAELVPEPDPDEPTPEPDPDEPTPQPGPARPVPQPDPDEPTPETDPDEAAADRPRIVLEHTRPTRSLNLYKTIGDDAVERPLNVLTGTLRARDLPGEWADADPCGTVTEIVFRLYDHGLMLLELLTDVPPAQTAPTDGLEARLDHLRDCAVSLGERIGRAIVRRYLAPVLRLLRKADGDAKVLARATTSDDPVTGDFGESLWVTRSLIVDPDEPGADPVIRHWVKDVVTAEDDRPAADRLLSGELDYLVRWLNYAFIDRTGAGGRMRPGDPFYDQWEALRYAQVFYGVLDRVDTRLSKILADSAAAEGRWELNQLKDQLTNLSRRAELIIMERKDLTKMLKRAVRVEMDAILGYWDYEDVLEEPVRFKVEICDRRLGELAAGRAARSTLFTDLILLGIGVTSIIGTVLAITDFGRSAATDPDMTAYDLGRSSIVKWISSQPADAILVASGAMSVLLVALYLFFRRDNNA